MGVRGGAYTGDNHTLYQNLSFYKTVQKAFQNRVSINLQHPLLSILTGAFIQMKNKSGAYTHIDNGAFWGRVLEHPKASKASQRVPQKPGPQTPVIYVCPLITFCLNLVISAVGISVLSIFCILKFLLIQVY